MFEQDLDVTQVAPDRRSDACGEPPTASSDRFLIFLATLLTMIPGGLVLIICLKDTAYGIQFGSIIAYTAATILYTFSANRGMQRYLSAVLTSAPNYPYCHPTPRLSCRSLHLDNRRPSNSPPSANLVVH